MPSGVGMDANSSSGNSALRFNLSGPAVGVGLGVELGNWAAVAVGGGVVDAVLEVFAASIGLRIWHPENKKHRARRTEMNLVLLEIERYFLVIYYLFSR